MASLVQDQIQQGFLPSLPQEFIFSRLTNIILAFFFLISCTALPPLRV